MQAEGQVTELVLLDGASSARIRCPEGLIPTPGQYVLAHAAGSEAPLATALFGLGAFPDGFVAAAPLPSTWRPGTRLQLRGPLGHGFSLPTSARRIALVAFRNSSRVLLSLLDGAFRQGASVTWVGKHVPDDMPFQVEAQPPHALRDVCMWADYVAFELGRERLSELKAMLQADRVLMKGEAQALVHTPMPCGALAACGVCTVEAAAEPLLACDDGPVFDFSQLMGWSSSA